jgi:Ca2+-binding EF-hand superfamily protein
MSTDSKITLQDVEEMMTEADTDGNGLIDYDEFVRVLVEKRT